MLLRIADGILKHWEEITAFKPVGVFEKGIGLPKILF